MNKVFMVMPFSDSTAKNAYTNCIKNICDEFKLEIRKADEIFTTSPIYDDIVKEIQEASIIIVDISGNNPNVFYELGMAHTLKRSHTIIITHEANKPAPFDIAHFRILQYEDSIEGAKKLESQLRKTIENLLKDYETLYKDEYNLVSEVMTSAGRNGELYAFLGIAKYDGVLCRFNNLFAEGHDQKNSYTFHSISIESGMKTFIHMGYLFIENDIVKITDKGNGFVSYLIGKGFVCDIFNEKVFTDGYKPLLERIREQNQNKKQEPNK